MNETKRMREKTALRHANKDTRPSATARYVRMGASKAKRLLDIIIVFQRNYHYHHKNIKISIYQLLDMLNNMG